MTVFQIEFNCIESAAISSATINTATTPPYYPPTLTGCKCPEQMHANIMMFKGINTGGYSHPYTDDGPVPIVFFGSMAPPADAYTHEAIDQAFRAVGELPA